MLDLGPENAGSGDDGARSAGGIKQGICFYVCEVFVGVQYTGICMSTES